MDELNRPTDPPTADVTAEPVESYPIELDAADEADTADAATPLKRGPDLATLLIGLLTLAMAVAAFVGAVPDLTGFDLRWVLAAGAAVVGAFLLVNGIRQRTRAH